MSPALKKKSPGFMVAMALKPKKDDEEEPDGYDDEAEEDAPEGDDDEAALSDAGTKIADALGLKPKDPAELARALLGLMDLHKEMKESEG